MTTDLQSLDQLPILEDYLASKGEVMDPFYQLPQFQIFPFVAEPVADVEHLIHHEFAANDNNEIVSELRNNNKMAIVNQNMNHRVLAKNRKHTMNILTKSLIITGKKRSKNIVKSITISRDGISYVVSIENLSKGKNSKSISDLRCSCNLNITETMKAFENDFESLIGKYTIEIILNSDHVLSDTFRVV